MAALACCLFSLTARAACTSPAGAAGTIIYSNTYSTLEYCNGTAWVAVGTDGGSGGGNAPTGMSFTAQTNQLPYNSIQSNVVTIAGLTGTAPVAVSGQGSPTVSINGAAFGSGGTIANGQTLQVQQTAAGTSSTTQIDTVYVGSGTATWSVTTGTQPGCTKVVTSSLNESSPLSGTVSINYYMIGGGGGGSGYGGGGGGGSSAIIKAGTLVNYASGGDGQIYGTAMTNPTVVSGTFSLANGANLTVYVGAGGGNGTLAGGGGGSGYYGGGGGSADYSGQGGKAGTNTGGAGGAGSTTGTAGISFRGGNGANSSGTLCNSAICYGGVGGNAASGGTPGAGSGAGAGGGGYGGGGGGGQCNAGSGGSSGANGTNSSCTGVGGTGANTWSSSTSVPTAAGNGGSAGTSSYNGGNAGLVILQYTAPSCTL